MEKTYTLIVLIQADGNRKVKELLIFKHIICVGSRVSATATRASRMGFKYIICVGSRTDLISVRHNDANLNTSYVSVQVV